MLADTTPRLFDPRTPWKWLDGSRRSQDNGFTMGWSGQAIVEDLAKNERQRATASRQVAKLTAQGHDLSSIALRTHRKLRPNKVR